MPKRGGLGQRGIDLLISASSGKTEKTPDDETVKKEEKTRSRAGAQSSEKKSTNTGSNSQAKSAAKSKTKSESKNEAKTGSKTGIKSGTKAGTRTGSKTGTRTGRKVEIKTDSSSEAAEKKEKTVLKKSGAGTSAKNRKAAKTSGKSAAANTHTAPSEITDILESSDSLRSTKTAEPAAITNEPLQIPIDQIEPNRSQPRKNFDEDTLQELADSIRQFGVIQPLIVQKKEDYYAIIAGERRWRAARIAGLKKLPVIVKEYTPREVMEISLIENIQREDLNPIEEATAYKNLMDEFNLRQDEVAQRVSRSRAAVANSLRLLNLDKRVQDMVVAEMLTTGHARALLAVTDPDLQYSTAQRVFDEKMSVREVERLVRRLNEEPKPARKQAVSETLLTVYASMAEEMKASLGTKVTISPKSAQKGRIEIEYYSADELDRLCALLKMPQSETRG